MTENKKNILIVCTGNTCRSPMAEGVLKHLLDSSEHHVHSAGLAGGHGAPPSTHAVELLQQEGIDISHHKSTMLTGDMLEEADLVLVMTEGHKKGIVNWFTGMHDKVHLLREYDQTTDDYDYPNIPDPIGASIAEYQRCLDFIKRSLQGVIKTL